jgi:hypothetical protein
MESDLRNADENTSFGGNVEQEESKEMTAALDCSH